jgi:hypothetical protein
MCCVTLEKLALKVTLEDAAFVVVVMELGARHRSTTLDSFVGFGGQKHSDWRRCEIDPERREIMRAKCRTKCARWIHAHAGKW